MPFGGIPASRVQVIHPFYVFQIASIILWSLDDYYYYAFCIALISAISIVTTLVETKKVCIKLIARKEDKTYDNRLSLECARCRASAVR